MERTFLPEAAVASVMHRALENLKRWLTFERPEAESRYTRAGDARKAIAARDNHEFKKLGAAAA